ncbi:hypothetical protein B296_00039066 [Ensete ventricosum]|uniref:Uncharacterized protein n=1 Tax=Ensete ventricosum TaxID=4639 RepID=A0A426ZES2_ENSVE|nr:hypothetical protein B296_00039066 [Ensete ventricosum]
MGLGSGISPSPTEQETPFYLSQTLHVPHERVVSGFYEETGAEEIASRGLPMVGGADLTCVRSAVRPLAPPILPSDQLSVSGRPRRRASYSRELGKCDVARVDPTEQELGNCDVARVDPTEQELGKCDVARVDLTEQELGNCDVARVDPTEQELGNCDVARVDPTE